MSRLKSKSRFANSSGGGSAKSGRKDGSSSRTSCSGLVTVSGRERSAEFVKYAHRALPASGSSAWFLTVRNIMIIALCAFCASERTYPHCCKYTRDTPYLHLD
jgi:hypothetical protein